MAMNPQSTPNVSRNHYVESSHQWAEEWQSDKPVVSSDIHIKPHHSSQASIAYQAWLIDD